MERRSRRRSSGRNRKALIGGILLVLGAAAFLVFSPLESVGDIGISETGTDQVEGSEYQRNYVECPEKYLDLCTRMSKKPREKVVFQRVKDEKLYLEMPETNRSMVVKLEDDDDGYLIRIEE